MSKREASDLVVGRFEDKYSLEEISGCWLWTASLDNHGYGQFCFNRKPVKAHRVSWELHRGPIPKGLCVLHKCDVRTCINPAHLFVGTRADNVADMIAKGRGNSGAFQRAQTHCSKGHPFNAENTRYSKCGRRRCRECGRKRFRDWYYAKKGAVNA